MATLYHYTNEDGYAGILQSNQLYPSTADRNPNDVRYGDGQYLSDIEPQTKTAAQLSRLFIGHPFAGHKYTHYVEVDVTDLSVHQGRPHIYVIPNDQPLELAERLISHGVLG